VVMSLGLIGTTLLGIYMAFKYNRDKRLVGALIFAGFIIPLALLYL
nr:PepSY domain-containing protein [Acidobacteriota bacterium]